MRLPRFVYLGIGWLAIGLALLGVALPVLPTVPFLIAAVWAFSRSSPVLAERIRRHPQLGPLVVAWERDGVIPFKVKVYASVMMLGSLAFMVWGLSLPWQAPAATAAVMAAVGAFIWTRPGA